MRFLFLSLLVLAAFLQLPILFPSLAPVRPFLVLAAVTGIAWLIKRRGKHAEITRSEAIVRTAVLLIAFFEIFPALLHLDLGLSEEIGSTWLAIALVFCFILGIIKTESQIPKLLLMVLIAVVWIMVGAQLTYSYAFETLTAGRLGAYGMYKGANDYGLILTCSVPIFLKLAEYYESKPLRIALYAMVPFCILHIYLTMSRGSLVGLAVILSLSILTKKGFPPIIGKILTAVVVFCVILGAVTMVASQRGGQSIAGVDDSTESRLDAWAACGRMLVANPLGVGFDQAKEYIMEYGLDVKMHPHNTYVKVAAEAGIAGFIALVVALYVTLNRLMKLEYYYRKIVPHRKVALVQALLFSLIAFLINTSFSQKEYEWLFYILIACSARLISFESKVIEGAVEQ